MTFRPSAPLDFNITYRAIEARGASDLSGNMMSYNYAFFFRTERMVPVEVLNATPSNDSVDVPLTSVIKVVFNKGVVLSSAESALSASPVVSGVFSWPDNSTMILTPGSPLLEKTRYTITESKDVHDQKGDTMVEDYAFSFTTGLAPDVTPPSVKITEPPDKSKVSETVTVKASATDNRAVAFVNFYLDGTKLSTASLPPYTWTWDTKTTSNGTHEIKAVAQDTSGNTGSDRITITVDNDLTLPTITETEPKNGSADVRLDAKISITFSEKMDEISVQGAFKISPSVNGTFSWNGSTVTFTPALELLSGTDYIITIDKGAKDMHGNSLSSTYSFSFRTTDNGAGIALGLAAYLIPLIAVVAIVLVLLYLRTRKRRERPAPEPKREKDSERKGEELTKKDK